MEQTTVLKLIARESCEATSSLIVIWRLAWAPLSVRNFNPFVVGTISPQKPCEINELKHDYARGEGDRGGSNNDDEDGDGKGE